MPETGSPSRRDPRLTGQFLRRLSGPQRSLTLVGVAHDHPASIYRVRSVIDAIEPDTLALELPPMAIALFEQYAGSSQTPPAFGGEMSAAIQTMDRGAVVGIDRPTVGYYRALFDTLWQDRPPLGTIRDVLSDSTSALAHAVFCRLAATLTKRTRFTPEADNPASYDVDQAADPTVQAADEHTQIRRSRAILDSLGSPRHTRASQIERSARDTEMAARLADLDGDVLAVVGISHLDTLVEKLQDAG